MTWGHDGSIGVKHETRLLSDAHCEPDKYVEIKLVWLAARQFGYALLPDPQLLRRLLHSPAMFGNHGPYARHQLGAHGEYGDIRTLEAEIGKDVTC